MKKLLTNLLMVAFLTAFVSATPFAENSKASLQLMKKASASAAENSPIQPQQQTPTIEPLDIFSMRYN